MRTLIFTFFACCIWVSCLAEPANNNTITRLIDTYGKETLIEVILQERFGQITIDLSGEYIDTFGRPDKGYITEETIAIDMEKSRLNFEQFTAAVKNYVNPDDNDSENFVDEDDKHSFMETAGGTSEACIDNCKSQYTICLEHDAEGREQCKALNVGLGDCFKKYTGTVCKVKKSDCELKCS